MQAGIIENLRNNFADNVNKIKGGPVQERQTNDKICYVFFVLLILVFLALGIYVISDQASSLNKIVSQGGGQSSSNVLAIVFAKYYNLIAVMLLLSIGISLLYSILIRYCLKCIVYTLVIGVFCIMFSILVTAIDSNQYGLIVAMSVGMLLFGIFLYCMRDSIELGMSLMEIASKFLSEKWSVYLSTLYVFLLSAIFFVFWMISVVSVQSRANSRQSQNLSTSGQDGIMFFFVFTYMFMTVFFYYVLSFLISTACAMWYFNLEGNYFCIATSRINRNHIGSFSFAALLLALVRFMQLIINNSGGQSENACARCVQCFISCILRQVEYLLRVLNNTSIIVMAITGDNYCDSAKTAAFVVCDHLGLYSAISVINTLLTFGGIILSVGIPTIAGLLYCKKNMDPTDTELDHLGLVILFATIILIMFFIGTQCQALNTVFVYYCLNIRFSQSGCVMTCPDTLGEFQQHVKQPSQAAHSANALEDNRRY